MRERVPQAEAKAETPDVPRTAPAEGHAAGLLALQRAAGNASVLAMLANARPAPPPPPMPSTSPSQPPIRRLWNNKTMSKKRFDRLLRGPGIVHDKIHEQIEGIFDQYVEAVEAGDLDRAAETLDRMIGSAKNHLRTNPRTAVDLRTQAYPETQSMLYFLDACDKEKGELEHRREHGWRRPPASPPPSLAPSEVLSAADSSDVANMADLDDEDAAATTNDRAGSAAAAGSATRAESATHDEGEETSQQDGTSSFLDELWAAESEGPVGGASVRFGPRGAGRATAAADGADPDIVLADGADPDIVLADGADPDIVLADGADPDIVLPGGADPDLDIEEPVSADDEGSVWEAANPLGHRRR